MPATTITPSRKQRDFDSAELEAFLASLSDLALSDLRRLWYEKLNTQAPNLRSAEILRQLLSWQLQEKEFGGLDRATERVLTKVSISIQHGESNLLGPALQLSPGVEVTREWKGVVHRVLVGTKGFLYLGKQYASLSEVARFITGTRWSGPRFFGLERRNLQKSDVAHE